MKGGEKSMYVNDWYKMSDQDFDEWEHQVETEILARENYLHAVGKLPRVKSDSRFSEFASGLDERLPF